MIIKINITVHYNGPFVKSVKQQDDKDYLIKCRVEIRRERERERERERGGGVMVKDAVKQTKSSIE